MNDREKLNDIRASSHLIMMFIGGIVLTIMTIGEKTPTGATNWWDAQKELVPELNTAILIFGFMFLILLIFATVTEPERPKKKFKKCLLCKKERKK